MSAVKFREGLLWAALSAGLAGFAFFLATSSAPPVRRYGFADFVDYYYAARAVGAGEDPYDAVRADAVAVTEGMPVLPGSHYIYPPWFAAALVLLARLSPRVAALVWFAASSAVLLVTLHRLLPPGSRAWALLAASFPPVLVSLFLGQVNVFLLGLLAGAWLYRDRRPLLAGAFLGIAAAVKLSPSLLVLYVLARGRRRMFAGAVLACALCAVTGEMLSPGGTMTYLSRVLPSTTSLGPGFAHPLNQSLGAFFVRLLAPNPWTRPWMEAPWLVRPLAAACSAALLGFVAWSLYRARDRDEADDWGALVAAAVVISPLAWEALFALLVLPAALRARGGGLTPQMGIAWSLIAAQRALGAFVDTPSAHPTLVAWPPLSSLALLGGLLFVVELLSSRRPHDRRTSALGGGSPRAPPEK